MGTHTGSRFILLGIFVLFCAIPCFASLSYLSLLPNALNVPCPTNAQNCTAGKCPAFGHMDPTQTIQECSTPADPQAVNNFGTDYKNHNNTWLSICNLDSDGDGYYNGDELGDPCCVWPGNTTSPRYTTDISHPGEAGDVPSSRASCHTVSTPPFGASILKLTGTSVKLTWSVTSLTCYCNFQVDILNGNTVYFTSNPLNTTQTISGLTPKTAYTMYIRAHNWAGDSAITPGSTVTFTTPYATVADPPSNITAVTTQHTINVTWAIPLNDGSSPISGYQIEWDDFYDIDSNSTIPTYSFQHLLAGEDYRIRIRTLNGVGYGNWSTKYKFTTKSSASTYASSLLLGVVAFLLATML